MKVSIPVSIRSFRRLGTALLGAALLGGLPLAQQTWYVDLNAAPGGNGSSALPFQTITEGVQASVNGDLVLVLPGVYDEVVAFGGREITVASRDGAAVTAVVRASGRAARFNQGETTSSVLEGFTLEGDTTALGGAVYVLNSGATLRDCIVENSATTSLGGGIACSNATLDLEGCLVRNNESTPGGGRGGGLYLLNSTVNLSRCQVLDNSAFSDPDGVGGGLYIDGGTVTITDSVIAGNVCGDYGGNSGGGIYTTGSASLTMLNCTVANNLALPGDFATGTGGGLFVACFGCSAFLRRNVFWNNVAPDGPQLANFGTVDADFNVFEGGLVAISGTPGVTYGANNLESDPLFVDPLTRDYHVSPMSPVVEAGGPAPLNGLDGDEDPRVLDGDGDGTAAIDIGWDEVNPTTLDVAGSPTLGGMLTLSTDGGPFQAFIALAGFQELDLALPPFGGLLVGGPVYRLGVGSVPGVTNVTIPMQPALVGQVVHFQSLAKLIDAPLGAFSRRVSLRIQ